MAYGQSQQYSEDSAHTSGDKGTQALAVRKDTAASIATTDGDYSPLQVDADGGLRLSLTSASGTSFASEDTIQLVQSNTQSVEDSVVPAYKTLGTDTYAEATTKGVVIGAVRRDADTTLVDTTNEFTPLQVDANGRLKVEAFSGETLPVSLASTTVTGTVAVTQSGTWDEVGINDSGNSITVDAPVGTPAFVRLSDGAAAITTLPVSLASVPSHAVTNAGTFATQVDGAALTALQLIDDPVFADDAAFTLSTSKGHVMAGVAVETDGTDPTSVSAEGDASAVRTDRNRRLLVNDMHPNSFVLFEDHTSAQTNNQLKAAPGAGLSIYITDVIFSNGATAGSIKLVEDEAGTPVQIGQTVYMGINGGAVMPFNTPKRLTANKSLGFTSTTVTTHSVEIHGYIAP